MIRSVDLSLHPASYVLDSNEIPLRKTVEEILLSLKFKAGVPETCSVIACLGIQFYKEEGGITYELETKRAMKIASVF